ncbi:MAG: hypothetical protein ACTSYD_04460 [Candidatus Heimdallarchaeaceae archaeon]
MASRQWNICLWQGEENCEKCELKGLVHCHLNKKISITFMIPFLIFAIPAFVGLVLLSFPLNLISIISWIGYMVFFFLIWEPPILCAHCPFYAEDSKILHCSINYGFYKTAHFNPKPINLSEKIQFLIGANLMFLIPIVFLAVGQKWIYLGISLVGIFLWYLILQLKICTVCINFSCVLNRTPKHSREQFLNKNPEIREAWQKAGKI